MEKMNRKLIWAVGLMLTATFALTSCSDDDDDNRTPGIPVDKSYDAYVVNNGNWGANDGTIGAIQGVHTDTPSYLDIYKQENNKGIGDAQDAYITVSADGRDGLVFVTSTTSSKISVLDTKGKELHVQLLPNVQPRYITGEGSDVYFSAYNGYVYKMNRDTYRITDSVKVGAYPEAVAIADGKLYAALSNYDMSGNGKYLAEVDLKSFKKTKDIEVGLNPYSQMVVVGSKVFFVSNLDYSDNILQMLDAATGKVTEIGHGTSIAYDKLNNDIVCVSAVYGHPEYDGIYRYNVSTGKKTDIKLSQTPGNIGQVSVSPQSGYLYIVNQSYTGPCELWVYDQYGAFKTKFQSGMATQQVIFLR